jgi:hypothetical protein
MVLRWLVAGFKLFRVKAQQNRKQIKHPVACIHKGSILHCKMSSWKMNTKAKFAAALMILILFLAMAGKTIFVPKADTHSPLAMPEEYINYTITRADGVLWAKIDGTYPLFYSGSNAALPMVYPTPRGTLNISLTMDDVAVDWSNYTGIYPEALHHTAIGDWPMVYCVLAPVPERFVLRIHYEHPVEVINGSYVFLYDLNISPYLSVSANKSIVHYTIRMDTDYTDLSVNTVFGAEETLKPIAYEISDEKPLEIRIDEVSEFDKPLPGDLLVSFKEGNSQEPLSVVWAAIWVLVGIAFVGLAWYGYRKRSSS